MPTYYEFFAGSGLVTEALKHRWTCLWANDIDPRKHAVYAANFPCVPFHLGDVAAVSAADLPPRADLAWASFPCQDLSLAGWRRGMAAARSGAFWAFWGLMRDLLQHGDRPPLIVIENVAGLLKSEDFGGLCQALAALEMQFGALLIDGRRFVPQSRPRVFIVAVDRRVDAGALAGADPEQHSPWHPRALRAAAHALDPSIAGLWRWWRLPTPETELAPIQSLIEAEPRDVAWHSPAETARLLSMMSPLHREKVRRARALGGRQVGFLYKRIRTERDVRVQRAEVRFDGLAGCLRTPNGGSSRQIVLVVEGEETRSRLLSPREAARLMGAPETFRLEGGYNAAYRAMGDGVIVPAARHLAEHLLLPLAAACERGERAALRGLPPDGEREHHAAHARAAELRRRTWEAEHRSPRPEETPLHG